ncbi:MAG: asparagine synthase (glutamine-hydrolyzing) [Phycisphaeraceae bacterium]
METFMCGIAGIVPFRSEQGAGMRRLVAMCDTLRHRGPDDAGAEVRDGVALGMRRLAIIDVAGGRQPIANEDGSVRVVFNGEIYNYRELRRELEAQGHRFTTATDTEVLVHLYEQHGVDMAEKLNGMFAVALHDLARRRVVLIRDHLGIKPLFYSFDNDRLVFGSEIKALLASGMVARELDVDALGQFMAWEYVPAPATLFKTVRKLEPGCLLDVSLDAGWVRQRRYWDVPVQSADRADLRPGDAWEQEVDAKVAEVVRRQMVSDVPLGAFLSGGVDSSLVVAGMGERAQTFSVGFEDPTYNELRWARRVANHLHVSHEHELLPPHVADRFDHLMQFMDDPIGDFSIFPTYLVSQHARRQVTVALSGDGGDELFGGYETYLAQARARQWQRLPSMLRKRVLEPTLRAVPPSPKKKGLLNKAKRFVEGFEHDAALGHARWRLFVGSAMRERLFTPAARAAMPTPPGEHIDRLARQADGADDLDRALYVDVKSYLVDNCLVKMDRMSMAASLEARVPLLDRELVELAFAMPARLKVHEGETKPLLKRVAARHVPRDCVYRPKEGFSIPMKHWLKTDFRPLMESLLAPRPLREQGLFDVTTVQRLKAEHLADRANHSHVLWSLMVFQDWRARWGVAG